MPYACPALMTAAAGRTADLRLIRLAGATRKQVIWLVTAEPPWW
ncbi:hypothetical protein [Micromonospora sp. NPDC049282]